ncbi:outer membrane beta-barrel protein [Pontibacter sp. SGAir0037]|uniref:outer membrane beta-barrel protein n=1 Tax=Pontibacter sp. SGAir0037 TaxID=2571030 RepID=UPI0010CD060D|nr:outer membrane beta-barrel protein [Pontibacter sp. SGAir0037]QCR23061.1 TonB-dependent receptor [Pontibacter sp. SGAir0037]
MKNILLFSFLLLSQLAFAQKYVVKGRVSDNTEEALPAATVLLLQAKDSSLVSFSTTNAEGAFEIKSINQGNYLLKITFLGFNPYFKKLELPTTTVVLDLGSIKLQALSKELQEVQVQADKSPVVIKKDTIEFNAGSFKTRPNAAVEEMLKKMPGVEIDADGAITVQGQKVQRVTVDGKEFFGKDPKVATKNLPADAIDKVQVFDKKSDQATFSGIDDGQREKTINLQLKEEKRNSAFGNVMAGAGTDERYQVKASVNRFKKGQQLSFLGMANNINSLGFGFDEYMNFNGGPQAGGGGLSIIRRGNSTTTESGIPLNVGGRMNGLMGTQAGGVNINHQFNKKTEANGSYFFNNLSQHINWDAERENFGQAGNFLSTENARQHSSNLNHRGSFTLDHKIDTVNSVKITGSLSYNETGQEQVSTNRTFSPEGTVASNSKTDAYDESNSFNLNTNLLYRHRFQKAGRFFSANALATAYQQRSDGFFNEETQLENRPARIRNQVNDQNSLNQTYHLTLSHTEPLGNRRYLEGNYSYRVNLNQSDRSVYDIVENDRNLNNSLSNSYNSNYQYHRAGVNFKMNRQKYNLTVGSAMQQSNLNGEVMLMSEDKSRVIDRSFTNVLPTAQFNYDFANNRRLNFGYETMVQEPTLRQLQPVPDISNPLSIYIGNPELEPAYMHQVRLSFNSFDAHTLKSFFGNINVMHTTNAIINAQTLNPETYERTTQPVNEGNTTMISAFLNYSFPIKKYNSRFNFGANVRDQYMVNVLNEVASDVNVKSATGNMRYTYRFKESLELSLRADLTAQRTRYEEVMDGRSNQFFFNKTLAGEANYTFLESFNFNATFDYLLYNNPGTNFNQAIPLLNMSFSKQFLKNNTGELKLSAVNMLDRNVGVTQTANAMYVERETLNSLGQYYMLSFTYTINKHLNPTAGKGGAVQIIR